MKSFLIICLLSLSPCISQAETIFGNFGLKLGGGFRLGKGESSSKVAIPYLGIRLSHTELKLAGTNRLSILPLGVSYDSDLVFSVSISPIMIIVPDKLSIALDYFLPSKHTSNVGNIGIFFGFPFGS